MADRTALITGASSGIGFAIAEMLCSEGYAVTMSARGAERLDAAAEELGRGGHDVYPVAANMADEHDVVRLVEAHRDRYGSLGVLVNNAGFGWGHAIDGYPTGRMDLAWAVNVRAPAVMYREARTMLAAHADQHGSALVVNTSSLSGKYGMPWLSIYSATKHALVGLTEAMNRELAGSGIKSCALCPGFVDTQMVDVLKDQISADAMIQPADLAVMVRALLHLSPQTVVPELLFLRREDLVRGFA